MFPGRRAPRRSFSGGDAGRVPFNPSSPFGRNVTTRGATGVNVSTGQSGTTNSGLVSPTPTPAVAPKSFFGIKTVVKVTPEKIVPTLAATISRDARAKLKPEDKQKLYKTFLSTEEIPSIEDLGASQDTIDCTYDTHLLVEKIEDYLGLFDMKHLFEFVVQPKKDLMGNTIQDCEKQSFNVFKEINRLTVEQVDASCKWWSEWVYNEQSGENTWILEDLAWSAALLKAKMSDDMLALVKDDLKNVYNIDVKNQGGPVIFKALMDRLLSSNHNTIRAIQDSLKGDELKLDEYEGTFLEFCNKIDSAIKRLEDSERVDDQGRKTESLVPDSLSADLYAEFQKTGIEIFDEAFKKVHSDIIVKGMMTATGTPVYPTPREVIRSAKALHRNLSISGKWTETIIQPTSFNVSGNVGKCFGCGRVGCRKDLQSCPRYGKSPTADGIAAKQAFWAAKKQRAEKTGEESQGKTEWPARPKRGESNRKKIRGQWYYYKFNTSRWEVCDNQDDAANEAQRVNLANQDQGDSPNDSDDSSNGHEEPGGFMAALLSHVPQGADQHKVNIQMKIYEQTQKDALAAFKAAVNT